MARLRFKAGWKDGGWVGGLLLLLIWAAAVTVLVSAVASGCPDRTAGC